MNDHMQNLRLALAAVLVGILAGAVCSAFHLILDFVNDLREARLTKVGDSLFEDVLIIACIAALSGGAAWLVRRFAPEASGSGIPHVEAILRSAVSPMSPRLLVVKFVGGVMAVGGGLALGREGPSVQMGAGVAHVIAKWLRLTWHNMKALIAGGAGAGLACAFNAPVAGALFVLEELLGQFDRRTSLVALGISGVAISVSWAIAGNIQIFELPELHSSKAATQPLFLLCGAFVGLLSVLYNRTIMTTVRHVGRLSIPVEIRAAFIGAVVGILALIVPDWIGGGEPLTQSILIGAIPLGIIPALFVFRLLISAFSYAAATPGGLFAPMLALGASAGFGFGALADIAFPALEIQTAAFAVVGMAAFFTGSVRAPLTGIVLVLEMTGDPTALLLPLLTGCCGATLVVEFLRLRPIYESLALRAESGKR